MTPPPAASGTDPAAMIGQLLGEGFTFYRWATPLGASGSVIRLVTSFCTAPADVDALLDTARRLAAG